MRPASSVNRTSMTQIYAESWLSNNHSRNRLPHAVWNFPRQITEAFIDIHEKLRSI